ncbi:MAG: hypothetical protein ACO2YP_00220, partial [Pseudomonadales bacterium]
MLLIAPPRPALRPPPGLRDPPLGTLPAALLARRAGPAAPGRRQRQGPLRSHRVTDDGCRRRRASAGAGLGECRLQGLRD